MLRGIIETFWRSVVLWPLMFWQGGFLFYASAVVPTAQDIIGHRQQGFITREVTVWLNNASVVSLSLLAVEMLLRRDSSKLRRASLWISWLAMIGCQAALFDLHGRMDALLDPDTAAVGAGFRPLHRAYLWIHTVQWAFAVASIWLLLASWRSRDAVP